MDEEFRGRAYRPITARTLQYWKTLAGKNYPETGEWGEDETGWAGRALRDSAAAIHDLAVALEGETVSPRLASALRGVVAAVVLEARRYDDATGALYEVKSSEPPKDEERYDAALSALKDAKEALEREITLLESGACDDDDGRLTVSEAAGEYRHLRFLVED